MARFAHWETGEEFLKGPRMRLARAELIMLLSFVAGEWADEVSNDPKARTIPFEQWTDEDRMREIARTYGLTGGDLGKLLRKLEEDFEWKAIQSGFDETWDTAPAPRKRKGR